MELELGLASSSSLFGFAALSPTLAAGSGGAEPRDTMQLSSSGGGAAAGAGNGGAGDFGQSSRVSLHSAAAAASSSSSSSYDPLLDLVDRDSGGVGLVGSIGRLPTSGAASRGASEWMALDLDGDLPSLSGLSSHGSGGIAGLMDDERDLFPSGISSGRVVHKASSGGASQQRPNSGRSSATDFGLGFGSLSSPLRDHGSSSSSSGGGAHSLSASSHHIGSMSQQHSPSPQPAGSTSGGNGHSSSQLHAPLLSSHRAVSHLQRITVDPSLSADWSGGGALTVGRLSPTHPDDMGIGKSDAFLFDAAAASSSSSNTHKGKRDSSDATRRKTSVSRSSTAGAAHALAVQPSAAPSVAAEAHQSGSPPVLASAVAPPPPHRRKKSTGSVASNHTPRAAAASLSPSRAASHAAAAEAASDPHSLSTAMTAAGNSTPGARKRVPAKSKDPSWPGSSSASVASGGTGSHKRASSVKQKDRDRDRDRLDDTASVGGDASVASTPKVRSRARKKKSVGESGLVLGVVVSGSQEKPVQARVTEFAPHTPVVAGRIVSSSAHTMDSQPNYAAAMGDTQQTQAQPSDWSQLPYDPRSPYPPSAVAPPRLPPQPPLSEHRLAELLALNNGNVNQAMKQLQHDLAMQQMQAQQHMQQQQQQRHIAAADAVTAAAAAGAPDLRAGVAPLGGYPRSLPMPPSHLSYAAAAPSSSASSHRSPSPAQSSSSAAAPSYLSPSPPPQPHPLHPASVSSGGGGGGGGALSIAAMQAMLANTTSSNQRLLSNNHLLSSSLAHNPHAAQQLAALQEQQQRLSQLIHEQQQQLNRQQLQAQFAHTMQPQPPTQQQQPFASQQPPPPIRRQSVGGPPPHNRQPSAHQHSSHDATLMQPGQGHGQAPHSYEPRSYRAAAPGDSGPSPIHSVGGAPVPQWGRPLGPDANLRLIALDAQASRKRSDAAVDDDAMAGDPLRSPPGQQSQSHSAPRDRSAYHSSVCDDRDGETVGASVATPSGHSAWGEGSVISANISGLHMSSPAASAAQPPSHATVSGGGPARPHTSPLGATPLTHTNDDSMSVVSGISAGSKHSGRGHAKRKSVSEQQRTQQQQQQTQQSTGASEPPVKTQKSAHGAGPSSPAHTLLPPSALHSPGFSVRSDGSMHMQPDLRAYPAAGLPPPAMANFAEQQRNNGGHNTFNATMQTQQQQPVAPRVPVDSHTLALQQQLTKLKAQLQLQQQQQQQLHYQQQQLQARQFAPPPPPPSAPPSQFPPPPPLPSSTLQSQLCALQSHLVASGRAPLSSGMLAAMSPQQLAQLMAASAQQPQPPQPPLPPYPGAPPSFAPLSSPHPPFFPLPNLNSATGSSANIAALQNVLQQLQAQQAQQQQRQQQQWLQQQQDQAMMHSAPFPTFAPSTAPLPLAAFAAPAPAPVPALSFRSGPVDFSPSLLPPLAAVPVGVPTVAASLFAATAAQPSPNGSSSTQERADGDALKASDATATAAIAAAAGTTLQRDSDAPPSSSSSSLSASAAVLFAALGSPVSSVPLGSPSLKQPPVPEEAQIRHIAQLAAQITQWKNNQHKRHTQHAHNHTAQVGTPQTDLPLAGSAPAMSPVVSTAVPALSSVVSAPVSSDVSEYVDLIRSLESGQLPQGNNVQQLQNLQQMLKALTDNNTQKTRSQPQPQSHTPVTAHPPPSSLLSGHPSASASVPPPSPAPAPSLPTGAPAPAPVPVLAPAPAPAATAPLPLVHPLSASPPLSTLPSPSPSPSICAPAAVVVCPSAPLRVQSEKLHSLQAINARAFNMGQFTNAQQITHATAQPANAANAHSTATEDATATSDASAESPAKDGSGLAAHAGGP